jgi:hypothetical protein
VVDGRIILKLSRNSMESRGIDLCVSTERRVAGSWEHVPVP